MNLAFRVAGVEEAAPMDLGRIRRDSLISAAGVCYRDFKQTLTPRYHLVWLHLLSGHAAILLTTAAIAFATRRWPTLAPLVVIGGAAAYGYAIAFIVLFWHEAAHFNLARDRTINDRLADIFIGSLLAQSIATYRPIHFDHHRYLGTPRDTERSYFDALSVHFLVFSLTGLRTLAAVVRRQKMAQADASAQRTYDRHFLIGIIVNLTIVGISAALGRWPVALAWTIGIAIVFPFLAALRQLLEHRHDQASPTVDYAITPHGAVNRMFGTGLVASTLGGAGFNRHLLHHWEPQISYTRLQDLEDYLADTPVASAIEQSRTSYGRTFTRLLRRTYGG